MPTTVNEAELLVGPGAIANYSRLSYQMWYALAEFIDNSTQSRMNYGSVIDAVLHSEGVPLIVDIVHNRPQKEIHIVDNSIGMTKDDLIEALKVAQPTIDSKGRSKYGMGMKTAACWIGHQWRIVTCEWSSGEEWTAEIDVHAVAHKGAKIPLSMRSVSRDAHYTRIEISELHRNIQKRSEETIKAYLGSMYRHDIRNNTLKLTYNGDVIAAPEDYEWDTDPSGAPMFKTLPSFSIGGKSVQGSVGVLKRGGRRFGGFSIFQNGRQIQGFPNAWKPRAIYGGIEDEGANNLIAQRLTGVLELDSAFRVSHTKDAILFEGDEEEDLEKFLLNSVKDYRDFAQKRRGARGQPWNREKVKDLIESMQKEFTSDEMKDAINSSVLPPIDTIVANNKKLLENLEQVDEIAKLDVLKDLTVIVALEETSEYNPHVTFVQGAEAGTIYIIINGLHPYYCSLDSSDSIDECIKQYIYDAISEYRVGTLQGRINPDSVRRLKDNLLRVQNIRLDNNIATSLAQEEDALSKSGQG